MKTFYSVIKLSLICSILFFIPIRLVFASAILEFKYLIPLPSFLKELASIKIDTLSYNQRIALNPANCIKPGGGTYPYLRVTAKIVSGYTKMVIGTDNSEQNVNFKLSSTSQPPGRAYTVNDAWDNMKSIGFLNPFPAGPNFTYNYDIKNKSLSGSIKFENPIYPIPNAQNLQSCGAGTYAYDFNIDLRNLCSKLSPNAFLVSDGNTGCVKKSAFLVCTVACDLNIAG